MEEPCCTCAKLLSRKSPQYDEKTEKPIGVPDRRLNCCGRIICGDCINSNARFATYCPFCQISTTPTVLPQGLRDPPLYSPPPSPRPSANLSQPTSDQDPPAYSVAAPKSSTHHDEKKNPTSAAESPPPDVLHFLDPSHDTISSLSLRYGVPAAVLRSTNNLFADHLLAARRTLLIPGSHYKGGLSLSPRPIDGEEEELRKAKVRRWMVACKVSEYELALVYLKQADYNLEEAIEAYREDERWEEEHPMQANVSGKAKVDGKAKDSPRKRRFGAGAGLVGQLS